MALGWEMVILFAGFSTALDNTQALSQKCLMDTNTFLWEIKQARPMEYAVQMYDSYGKLGSNVKGGNVDQAGALQQCHSANAATFSGQYCQVFLRQETVNYFVAICVPDTCSQEEVETLVLHGKLQIDQISLIPPLPSILVNGSTQEMFTTDCLFKPRIPDASAITCLFMCCLMVAIPLVATLHTAIIKWQRNKEVSPTAESLCLNSSLNLYGTLKNNGSSMTEMNADTLGESGEDSSSQSSRCFLSHFLHVFSLQTTSQGVFSTASSVSGRTYSSFNGIRVLSLFWIISQHVGYYLSFDNLDNLGSWKETFRSNPVYMLSMTGPVFLAVDTFLLLGGFLSAKSLLGAIRGAEDKMSFPLVAKYLLNRMKRIQPLHMFILCLTTGPLSMVPRGPFSTPFTRIYHDCKDSWWANILLISNFFEINDTCIPWAWYLSLDFQGYLTTPLIVILYRLNKTVFAVVSGLLLLITMVISTVVSALMVLPVLMPAAVQNEAYGRYYYGPPYTRYGQFLIGIVAGILLTTKTDRWLKKKWHAAIGWILCLTLLAAVSVLPYVLEEKPLHPSAPHALYSGTHRSLWALALTWIIVACEEGYGGFVNRFLSWGFWTPLSKISFASYLVHPLVIFLHLWLQDNSISYSDTNFLYLFLGNLAITLLVSLLLHVLIEKPYTLLKFGCP